MAFFIIKLWIYYSPVLNNENHWFIAATTLRWSNAWPRQSGIYPFLLIQNQINRKLFELICVYGLLSAIFFYICNSIFANDSWRLWRACEHLMKCSANEMFKPIASNLCFSFNYWISLQNHKQNCIWRMDECQSNCRSENPIGKLNLRNWLNFNRCISREWFYLIKYCVTLHGHPPHKATTATAHQQENSREFLWSQQVQLLWRHFGLMGKKMWFHVCVHDSIQSWHTTEIEHYIFIRITYRLEVFETPQNCSNHCLTKSFRRLTPLIPSQSNGRDSKILAHANDMLMIYLIFMTTQHSETLRHNCFNFLFQIDVLFKSANEYCLEIE